MLALCCRRRRLLLSLINPASNSRSTIPHSSTSRSNANSSVNDKVGIFTRVNDHLGANCSASKVAHRVQEEGEDTSNNHTGANSNSNSNSSVNNKVEIFTHVTNLPGANCSGAPNCSASKVDHRVQEEGEEGRSNNHTGTNSNSSVNNKDGIFTHVNNLPGANCSVNEVGDFNSNSSVNNKVGIFTHQHHHVHVQEGEEEEAIESKLASLLPRLHLHNRVKSLITLGKLDDAVAQISISDSHSSVLPMVNTCNLVLQAMCRANRFTDAKALFRHYFVQSHLLHPNDKSYEFLLISHCRSNNLDQAFQIYRYLFDNTHFYLSNPNTYALLFRSLIDAGRITDAAFMFWEIPTAWRSQRRLIYRDNIFRLLKARNFDKAKQLFDEMEPLHPDQDESDCGIPDCTPTVDAAFLNSYFEMKEVEVVNSEAINKMVNKCFEDRKFNEAMDVFNKEEQGGKMDLSGFNNMIARLSQLHMMAEAEHYYQLLWNGCSCPDVHTYVPMIDAYICLDRVDDVLDKFMAMVNLKLAANASCRYTTNKCFGFLINRGRALDCAPILSKMIRKGMEVDATTCNTVIRGLVNQGHFDATIYYLLWDMKEFQCNIVGMQTPPSNTDDSCSTVIIPTADDYLDTDVGFIPPPKDGELEQYGLDEGFIDPELAIANLRPKFQLHHRVKSLLRAGDLDAAARMIYSAADSSVLPLVDTCNEIMEAMYHAKRYRDAKAMFDYFFEHDEMKNDALYDYYTNPYSLKSKKEIVVCPDAKSYNIGILSRCELTCGDFDYDFERNEADDVHHHYYDMRSSTTLAPSLSTYLRLIRKIIEVEETYCIFTNDLYWEMMRKWGKKHPWVYNLAILELLSFGELGEAKKMFDELKKWRCPDFAFTGVVDTTFLNSFPIRGEKVASSSDDINAMVNECFKAGKVKEAMDSFDSFAKGRDELELEEHFRMDLAGFNNMIARLCELRMMDEAENYYQQLWSSSSEIPDVHTYIPFIDAYLDLLKTDNTLEKVRAMLNLELESDYSIPTSCLSRWFGCLVKDGRASDCAHILSKVLRKGMKVGYRPCKSVVEKLFDEGRFHAAHNLLCDMKEFERNINWNVGNQWH